MIPLGPVRGFRHSEYEQKCETKLQSIVPGGCLGHYQQSAFNRRCALDDYSDFGSEVSPRAGLTWEFSKGYDLKLLYGHAFRAPSFYELYNLGFAMPGNDLDPETTDTYEASLGAEFTPLLTSRFTFSITRGRIA